MKYFKLGLALLFIIFIGSCGKEKPPIVEEDTIPPRILGVNDTQFYW